MCRATTTTISHAPDPSPVRASAQRRSHLRLCGLGEKTPAEAGGWGAKCLVHRIAGCSAELLCSLIIFFPFLIRVPKGKALVAFRLNSPCHRHKLSKEGEFSFCSWLSLKHISFFLFLTVFLEDSAL